MMKIKVRRRAEHPYLTPEASCYWEGTSSKAACLTSTLGGKFSPPCSLVIFWKLQRASQTPNTTCSSFFCPSGLTVCTRPRTSAPSRPLETCCWTCVLHPAWLSSWGTAVPKRFVERVCAHHHRREFVLTLWHTHSDAFPSSFNILWLNAILAKQEVPHVAEKSTSHLFKWAC